MKSESNLVSVEWLQERLDDPKIVVLFTTMKNPATGQAESSLARYIPGSVLFDFEDTICDKTSALPHTMPDETLFTTEVQKLGIDTDSTIVIYDAKGVYCAPRVWWMFIAMGHKHAKVLNGGLPAWLDKELPVQAGLNQFQPPLGNFQGGLNKQSFIDVEQILAKANSINLLDARSAGRFNGTEPEPRAGLRPGHAPGAINLPFIQCIEGQELKQRLELQALFSSLSLSNKPLVFSCGSGVTACVLALAASEAGYENLAVYDGSWSEWGARLDLPVEVN